VDALPQGPHSHMESEHVDLSVGQKHRLTLARAFARRSSILLLDEPFANVDPHLEARIWRNILSFRGKRTVLIATHRFPPPGTCDLVLEVAPRGH